MMPVLMRRAAPPQSSGPAPASGPQWLASTSSVRANDSGNTLAVVMPATVDAGDLLLMHVCNGESFSFSVPAGWTALGSLAANSTMRGHVFYRIADGTEDGATVTVTAASSCYIAAVVNRIKAGTFNATTPVERATPATGGGSQPNSPSYSPSWGSAATLWLSSVAANYVFPPHTVTSWPYAGGQTAINAPASGASVVMMRSCEAVVSAASEDPAAWAMGSNVNLWIAETLAVRPAA